VKQALSDFARKSVALLVLLFAAFILFKVVIGAVTAVAWLAVGVLAVIAVLWAVLRLL
jgi:hypothetical protein